jgi:hypothetical protein
MPKENEWKPSAPVMNRSRTQLATAYAPGAFFTFEGGQGACIALSDAGAEYEPARISESAKKQIIIRLAEIVRSWFDRAMNCRPGAKYQPHPRMCVDDALLRGDRIEPLDRSRIEFVSPAKMGYAPAPLTFVCNTCSLFRRFDSVKRMGRYLHEFKPQNCPHPKHKDRCQWRQLDVIFVHWSGYWEPATPGMYEWDDKEDKLVEPRRFCSQCDSRDFTLNASSPSIGKWYFQCATCGHRARDSWLQNDRITTEILRSEAGSRNTERRMEAISYRASSVFYPQFEQFIVFEEGEEELLSMLDPTRLAALENFIAKRYGFGATRPPIEKMKELLEQGGRGIEWKRYEDTLQQLNNALQMAKMFSEPQKSTLLGFATKFEQDLAAIVDSWFDNGYLQEINELPSGLKARMCDRSAFSARYDPFALAVEHEAVRKNKLDLASDGTGRRAFVRFTALDQHLAPESKGEQTSIEDEARRRLVQLGIEEMGLIREFDLCRFTYSFTRVQSVPFFEKRNQNMPVRLNLFPSLENNKKPVYAITQANEAIYVRLDAKQVYRWLQAIQPTDLFDWVPDGKVALGAHLLEYAVPFGRYLSNLHKNGPAQAYLYVYTLLHTYAHVLMKAISEHSGLDLGTLSEYIFPVDLAFVVYRNGTTIDLGKVISQKEHPEL